MEIKRLQLKKHEKHSDLIYNLNFYPKLENSYLLLKHTEYLIGCFSLINLAMGLSGTRVCHLVVQF